MNLSQIYYLHEIGGKKNQEDYIWPAPGTATQHHKIFIVCDGVGGSENGEVASKMIAEFVGNHLLQLPAEKISINFINDLLSEAKLKLVAYSKTAGLNKDMATTFSVLILFNDKAFIAWCGDTRVYQVRNGEILYKTSDHSLVNSLVKNGEITEEEAMAHPKKHIILKAINADDKPAEAEGEWINDIATDDYFMLCTDGLLENITDADLKILLTKHAPGNDNIIETIQQYCYGKTRDNYSLYLVQIDLAGAEPVQSTPQMPAAKKSYTALWLMTIAVIAIAVAVFYFVNNKDHIVVAAPRTDSVIQPANIIVRKDSLPEPEKDSTHVMPVNAEEKEERDVKKITPAPLTETKISGDSFHHLVLPKKNKPLAPAIDSSNHGKSLN